MHMHGEPPCPESGNPLGTDIQSYPSDGIIASELNPVKPHPPRPPRRVLEAAAEKWIVDSDDQGRILEPSEVAARKGRQPPLVGGTIDLSQNGGNHVADRDQPGGAAVLVDDDRHL